MNAAGGLESHLRYHPYGMTWTQTAAPATDRLFTGHQQMGAKSGSYYANARFYSADIGRFQSPDAVVRDPFDPQALSRYSYARNNPTNYTDPTGNFFDAVFPWCCLEFPWLPGSTGVSTTTHASSQGPGVDCEIIIIGQDVVDVICWPRNQILDALGGIDTQAIADCWSAQGQAILESLSIGIGEGLFGRDVPPELKFADDASSFQQLAEACGLQN
jgi:RHS repeat-associated protein